MHHVNRTCHTTSCPLIYSHHRLEVLRRWSFQYCLCQFLQLAGSLIVSFVTIKITFSITMKWNTHRLRKLFVSTNDKADDTWSFEGSRVCSGHWQSIRVPESHDKQQHAVLCMTKNHQCNLPLSYTLVQSILTVWSQEPREFTSTVGLGVVRLGLWGHN